MEKIYSKIAEKYGITSEEVEKEIAKAIKETWRAPDGSREKSFQLKLFPDGKTPSNKDFIDKIALIYKREKY